MVEPVHSRSPRQGGKSLARLAAEAAFLPEPERRPTDDAPRRPSPFDDPIAAHRVNVHPATAPVHEGREPRVFRVSQPVASRPDEVDVASPSIDEAPQVARAGAVRSAADRRPGPVTVVFSRPEEPHPVARHDPRGQAEAHAVEPEDESPPEPRSETVRATADSFLPADAHLRATAGLAELDEIFASIDFARSFKRALAFGETKPKAPRRPR